MSHVPTEEEKLNGDTSHTTKGKMTCGDQVFEVDITTETKPNQTAGYDTVVKIPENPMSAANET